MGRDGTGAAAHSAARFVQNFKLYSVRSVVLIDVFGFSVFKSPGVPSFTFIRVTGCDILKIFENFTILYYICIENTLKIENIFFAGKWNGVSFFVNAFLFCVEKWSTIEISVLDLCN